MNSKDLSNNTNDAACDNCHLVHALDQVVDEVLSVAMVTALNVMQSLLVHARMNTHLGMTALAKRLCLICQQDLHSLHRQHVITLCNQ